MKGDTRSLDYSSYEVYYRTGVDIVRNIGPNGQLFGLRGLWPKDPEFFTWGSLKS